jgi:hypothetical protein
MSLWHGVVQKVMGWMDLYRMIKVAKGNGNILQDRARVQQYYIQTLRAHS